MQVNAEFDGKKVQYSKGLLATQILADMQFWILKLNVRCSLFHPIAQPAALLMQRQCKHAEVVPPSKDSSQCFMAHAQFYSSTCFDGLQPSITTKQTNNHYHFFDNSALCIELLAPSKMLPSAVPTCVQVGEQEVSIST